MTSPSAVSRSAQSICSANAEETPSRRPMNRIRTPSALSSGVSPRIRSENIRIRPVTSSAGRDQFSVENEYTVSSSTPRSTASRSRAFTVSAPARCPSTTGSPRAVAQRPFPSVMMATYRAGTSDLEDLGFLGLEQRVELADLLVREPLQLGLAAMLLVRPRLARLLELAQVVHAVAADVADRDAAVLGDVAHHLHELLATLLGELGDRQPDDLPVVVRREPEVGLHDRLLDRLDRRRVIGRHAEQARLGRGDRRELAKRRDRAVVVDVHAVEQRRAGTSRPHGAELVADRLDRLHHALA